MGFTILDNLTGSIDEPVEDGDTALHLTCLYGHFECAQVCYHCSFIIFYACIVNHVVNYWSCFNELQLLLERGANLEANDEDGAIPLHDACAGGSYVLNDKIILFFGLIFVMLFCFVMPSQDLWR